MMSDCPVLVAASAFFFHISCDITTFSNFEIMTTFFVLASEHWKYLLTYGSAPDRKHFVICLTSQNISPAMCLVGNTPAKEGR